MPNKFHPDDLKNPLYEHSQVVTIYDLMAIYKGLAKQYSDTKWYQFHLRYGLAIAGHTIYEIIAWLQEGKPRLRGSGDTR